MCLWVSWQSFSFFMYLDTDWLCSKAGKEKMLKNWWIIWIQSSWSWYVASITLVFTSFPLRPCSSVCSGRNTTCQTISCVALFQYNQCNTFLNWFNKRKLFKSQWNKPADWGVSLTLVLTSFSLSTSWAVDDSAASPDFTVYDKM